MAKKKHKFKVGEMVEFKFFDGGVYKGEIVKLTYSGDMWGHIETDYSSPQYTIHKEDNSKRGYTSYPGIGLHRILSSDGIVNKKYHLSPAEKKAKRRKRKIEAMNIGVAEELQGRKEMDSLDQAIEKQKAFINGRTKEI